MKSIFTGLCCLFAFCAWSQQLEQPHFDGASWWDTVKVLADDNMEGRETGSAGLRRAEAYMVEQLKEAGLQPIGRRGYYQPIAFRTHRIIESQSSIALIRNGLSTPLPLGDDAYFSLRVHNDPLVQAPLVFAGYGLKIPERNYDDFAGLNLKGRIAVVIGGSPGEIPSALASHYQSPGVLWKALEAAGAIGLVTIRNPASMDVPWKRNASNQVQPIQVLAGAEFDETAGQKLGLIFNPARAEILFAGSGHKFAEIAALARDRKPMPHFPLAMSLRAKARVISTPLTSANVIAELPGSDPVLKHEYVVLTAHIDHLGIGASVGGDRIYNGAMDNAAGDAAVLDVARWLRSSGIPLRRSVLFVLFTGEEEGLLGSKFFTEHPPVDPKSIVANINTDMFLPIIPLKILRVYGLDESDIGAVIRRVAKSQGIAVQADPEPLRNMFIRSDQYNFILHGVPAIAMKVGYEPGTPEATNMKEWLTERYHAPSDDVQQPVNFEAAASFEDVLTNATVILANQDARPKWKLDSFFGRYVPVHGLAK